MSMAEPQPAKKPGFISALMIVVAAALMISPSYVGGYLLGRGRLSISLVALLSLAMFLVGAFLMLKLLKD